MPKIPIYEASGNVPSGVSGFQPSGDPFGGFARGIEQMGQLQVAKEERDAATYVTENFSKFQLEQAEAFQEQSQNYEDIDTFTDGYLQQFKERADAYIESAPNEQAKALFAARAGAAQSTFGQQAIKFQVGERERLQLKSLDESLNNYSQLVRQDPSMLDAVLMQVDGDVAGSRTRLSGKAADKYRTEARKQIANSALYDMMMSNPSGVQNLLQNPIYSETMTPEGFATVLRQTEARQKKLNKAAEVNNFVEGQQAVNNIFLDLLEGNGDLAAIQSNPSASEEDKLAFQAIALGDEDAFAQLEKTVGSKSKDGLPDIDISSVTDALMEITARAEETDDVNKTIQELVALNNTARLGAAYRQRNRGAYSGLTQGELKSFQKDYNKALSKLKPETASGGFITNSVSEELLSQLKNKYKGKDNAAKRKELFAYGLAVADSKGIDSGYYDDDAKRDEYLNQIMTAITKKRSSDAGIPPDKKAAQALKDGGIEQIGDVPDAKADRSVNVNVPEFATEADAEAAGLKDGTTIKVGGKLYEWRN